MALPLIEVSNFGHVRKGAKNRSTCKSLEIRPGFFSSEVSLTLKFSSPIRYHTTALLNFLEENDFTSV